MKLLYDIHTHTNYSHGKSTIEQMVQSAREKGLEAIYITEHAMNHHYAKHLNSEKYLEMKCEIERLRQKYDDIKIFFGTEANFISTDGSLDIPDSDIEIYDVILAGFHVMCRMKSFKDFLKLKLMALLVNKLKFGFLSKLSEKYCTQAVMNALDRYDIRMITHPMSNYRFDLRKVAEKCAQKNTILEINNNRRLLNCEYIKSIKDIDVMFAVGSDAHNKNDVAKVDEAVLIALESGVIDRVVNISVN